MAAPADETRRTLVSRVQRFDLRNTWQVAVGAFLVPVGIVVVLIAWYGSAHTPYVQQQIPYLVSGSFIGLGLMIVGGLLYWAHWLYRIYDQADLNHAAGLARQEELIERLIDAIEAGRASAPPDAAADGLVATATGANVHRVDCPIVSRHPDGIRHLSAEEASGRPRCRICLPV
jgi:hypothetical protein